MAEKECVKRLQKEIRAICKEPPPQIVARPSSSDILDWHFVLEGSEGTPFEGGYYYGKLKFPPDYPYKPPSISMVTPNGRFATEKKICLSMSDYHPESWNPMWSVSSILTGLLSFMMDDQQTTGSIKTSDDEKRKLAKNSLAFNCQSKACTNFRKLFPEYVEKYCQQQASIQRLAQQHMQDNLNGSTGERIAQQDNNRAATKAAQKRQKKPLPFWLVLFLISIFGALMSLPLMQL